MNTPTIATIKINKCSAINPIASPAFVSIKIKLTIDPITRGKALADFEAKSFNQLPNVSSVFLIFDLSGGGGEGGSGGVLPGKPDKLNLWPMRYL